MDSATSIQQVDLARAKFEEHAYEEVTELLAPILKDQPMHAHALHLMTGALIQLNRFEEAVTPALRLAVVEPNVAEARYYAGLALSHANRHREAIEHLEAVIHIRGNYLDTAAQLGKSLFLYAQSLEATEPKTAEMNYRRAAEIMPDRPEPVVSLIRVLQNHGSKNDLAFCIQQLPKEILEHPLVKPLVEAVDADPDVHNLLHETDSTPHSVDDPRGSVKILTERELAMRQRENRFDPAPTFMAGGGIGIVCGLAAVGIGFPVMNGGMPNASMLGGILIGAGILQAVMGLWLIQKGTTM